MKNMKRILLVMVVVAGIFTACDDDDEIVEVKDYGLKTFTADLAYDASIGHGEGTNYTQQTYFAFGEETKVAFAVASDTLSWTDFSMIKDPTHADYNISTDVTGWDLVFSYYTEEEVDMGGGSIYLVGATGVLINTEADIEVGLYEYTESIQTDSITSAFGNLSLEDLVSVEYDSSIDVIGHSWKSYDMSNSIYNVNPSMFFIVKLMSGDIYKLRFTSFYGSSTDERVIKMEYQLMQ